MARKPALGKGLDALLNVSNAAGGESEQQRSYGEAVAIDRIFPSSVQPRSDFDKHSLEELAESIKVQGLMQPVLVRSRALGGFELIAGERRWRAAHSAGLSSMPVVVREVDDAAAVTLALVENLQREDLNPMDEARALGRLSEEFGMTHEAIAQAVGKSRAGITNLLRFLKLEPQVADLLAEGSIEAGHAKVLLGVPGKPQIGFARKAARDGLSVRALEALVQRRGKPRDKRDVKKGRDTLDPQVVKLERELSDELGTTVAVRPSKGVQKGNRGELAIKYHSFEELNGVIARIRRKPA